MSSACLRRASAIVALLSITHLGDPMALAGSVPLRVVEDASVARAGGLVTSGVPFPMGLLKREAGLQLQDEQGRAVPLQSQVSATWRDGSVKWLLLDFVADVAPESSRQFRLAFGEAAVSRAPPRPLRIEESPQGVRVDTGRVRFNVAKDHIGFLEAAALDADGDGVFVEAESLLPQGLMPVLTVTNAGEHELLAVQPPESVVVEEAGPIRAVVKADGWLTDAGTNRLVQYSMRIHASAGSASVRVEFTVTQLSDHLKMLWVRELGLSLRPRLGPERQFVMGGQPAHHQGPLLTNATVLLSQLAESRYDVRLPDGRQQPGLKAPGWLNLNAANGGVLVAVRDFWPQFPKSILAGEEEIRLGLYPAQAGKPFDMDQGLAKTHEILLTFHEGRWSPERCAEEVAAFERPLFAVAPPSWFCDSKAFGDLQPFDFDRFPDYETLTEASGDQFIRKMATGIRHWGDLYYGGEFKGTNAYMNLEYDVHHNFYCQFTRTGLRKYLDAALRMAKHQADIDTNHKTGWQWKHSPRHVETQAEFGHTFTRGLLETYYLTGNRRCRDAALELGTCFAKEIQNPRSTGNERQIGWGLISLLPVFEATWDPKFFLAASNTVDRLIRGLDARGRFSIRWDNRIAFFNGIAATGFLYYYRATGDERVADAAYRVIKRTRGFYPEYAGRTLEAIAWACERTQEPEWFDFLKLTWETTLARSIGWNTLELGAPTIFTAHALPFLAQSGFIPPTERPLRLTPDQFDTANGLHAHHLPAGDAELFLQVTNTEPFDLVVVRKGAWKSSGTAALFDPSGARVTAIEFPREGRVWQRQVVPVRSAGPGTWRLMLRSIAADTTRGGGSYVTWDVVTSRPMPAVFTTRDFKNIEFVTPSLYAIPRGDGTKIELELSGEGEGFKKAVILDPDGHVAGSTEAFIDLGDKGRYFYTVNAIIPPHQATRLWRLVLQDVSLIKLNGLSPYFSTSAQSFFSPERLASSDWPAE